MSWTAWIDAVAEEAELPRATTRKALTAAVTVAVRWLAEGREVPLRGLGTLSRRWVDGRVVRSVADSRRMYVGGRFVARFRASSALRRELADGLDDTWRTPEHQAAWRLAETLVGDLDLYHGADAPADLEPALSAERVEAACAEAFGPHWQQARDTWVGRVPAEVATSTHYLGIAARRRWARA